MSIDTFFSIAFSFVSSAFTLSATWFFIKWIYIFWIAYVVVIGCYRAHLRKRLTPVTYVLAAPALLVGVFMDVTTNLVLDVVWDRQQSEWLVTKRFIRYQKTLPADDTKRIVAEWVCKNALDPFEERTHCFDESATSTA